ncbi:hypothetical protein O181_023260 [Austropuccinia psidii MF-1]|uniref:Uncharacterized protein n=1 Tax=Austropuccinia psidii MF-1 TaxID=1389203 RepID=A0A9Q3CI55_9BASI|nr:hypothetical protein [Austropuccinia psidii MF-1]
MNPPRSDEPLRNPQNVLERAGNSEILQWIASTIIQNSNKKYERMAQKERGKQGRSPSIFYQKATSLPTSTRREEEQEKNWKKQYSTSYQIPRIQKDAMENVFRTARTLMEFKDKEEQRMKQPSFPKK